MKSKTNPPVVSKNAAFAGSTRSALVDVLPLALSCAAAVVLTIVANRNDAGSTPDLSIPALVVILLGGVINTALLAWFRAGEIRRNSSRTYVVPRWNPARVAAALVVVGWCACLLASFWTGLSWSRR